MAKTRNKKPAKAKAGTKKTTTPKPRANAAGNSAPAGKRGTQATEAAGKNPPQKGVAKTKKPPKRKNVSQKIPNGRVLQTRDEYLGEENKNFRKPGYDNKGLYRGVVVVDSNRLDEVVVVKLTTSDKGIEIETYKGGKSKFKPFVEVRDESGNPIKPGKHFVPKPKKNDLLQSEVTKIKKTVFKEAKTAKENRKKVREIKGRKTRGK